MGGGDTPNNKADRIGAFQISSSAYSLVIPRGWGRARLALNLGWLDGFHSEEVKQKQGGGKGGGENTTITYQYFADLILFICDTSSGRIIGVNSIYKDKSVYSGATCVADAGFSVLRLGLSGQEPWYWLADNYPDAALGYDTLAYICGSNYQLNDQAGLQNLSAEVDFHMQVGNGIVDANPGDHGGVKGILHDFLIGCVPQWPDDAIGDLANYGTYCLAANLLLSPCLDSQVQASDFVDEILKATNSTCWMRGDGTLQVKPYGDASVTNNGVTWNPNLTPVYDLTDDDFIVDNEGDDPVKIDTENLNDLWNIVPVSFKNREHQYNDETVTGFDQASAEEYGKRKRDPESLPSIKDPTIARLVAQLLCQRYSNFARPFVFKLPFGIFDRLEEMDYLTITNEKLGLSRQLVLITEIDEDQDTGDRTVKVTEVLVGTANAPMYPSQTASGVATDFNADAGSVASPVLFIKPTTITNGRLVVAGAVGSTNPNYGGCQVWVALDDGTGKPGQYQYVDTIKGSARYGVTTTDFPAHADPDAVDALTVDLTISNGQLLGGTQADANALVTLCWVGGELIAYRDATVIASGVYDLQWFRRGAYQSVIADHPPSTEFVRLDDSVFEYEFLSGQIGQTIHVKLRAFNLVGNRLQDLADTVDYTVTLTQPGTLPGPINSISLQSPWVGKQFTAVCSASQDALTYTFRVYLADGTTLVHTSGATPSTSFTYTQDMAAADGYIQREYKITTTPSNFSGDGAVSPVLDATNPAPAAVTGLGKTGSGGSVTITWSANNESDRAGYVAYYSQTNGFDPTQGDGAEFYEGTNASAPLSGLTTGQTYYVRVAAYDTWSDDVRSLNFSAQYSFTA